MSLRFCSFSSGSSGNCYLVRTEKTAVLVDAGISASRIINALVRAMTDPDEIKGILITHGHTDHIKGMDVAAKRLDSAQIFASKETLEYAGGSQRTRMGVSDSRKERFSPGDCFAIGDIEVSTIPLEHDAQGTVGFVLKSSGGEVAIITDTGVFTPEMASMSADADVLVIEANHDTDMLLRGSYPAHLKQRILSEQGHLSNAAAARAIMDVYALDKKPRCILLAHLSQENNTPHKAEQTVGGVLAEAGLYSGRDLYLKALLRDRQSVLFEM